MYPLDSAYCLQSETSGLMLSLHTGDCSMSQFQSRLTNNEEALGDHFNKMERKKFTHTHKHKKNGVQVFNNIWKH